MSLTVRAPVSGTVRELSEVPDPVFAQAMIGAGLAIDPEADGSFEVVSPLRGRVLTLHPHAAVILSEAEEQHRDAEDRTTGPARRRGVLIHVGIDTVRLKGIGFTLHVRAGEHVELGQPLVTVDPAAAREAGYSLLVPVVAMEAPTAALGQHAPPDHPIAVGDQLYTWL
ncbi:PTS sugar transporter subunit IIA [Bogoriella caseilytica]|uniref:PTS system N-acetylglucosamine-specific IIA component (Glc family) n=1 Tax=Bogoriella caseilytica TaxID=56055 RepID=A0A3N2BF59_9MICO|nr:PTS glucose transporter subunit IIA [Bogoriella caseilytica]ROR73898.1 PTS system N-acetylglucosamine-specific IIA component (Glc family) [Bogoriella caseilytica]